MGKDGTFYFSHDYNARTDSKVKKLLSKHGYAGYGIFWAIIEDLYNNANALPTDYDSMAFDMHSTKEIIESIVTSFDLFVIEGESFSSNSVQRRLAEREEKSNKAKKSAEARWGKADANALPTQSESNAIKESKGKENKGDTNNSFFHEDGIQSIEATKQYFYKDQKVIEYTFREKGEHAVKVLMDRFWNKQLHDETITTRSYKEFRKHYDNWMVKQKVDNSTSTILSNVFHRPKIIGK